MSATIDEKPGRTALKKTLLNGLRDFIEKYNSLADEGEEEVVDLYSMRKS